MISNLEEAEFIVTNHAKTRKIGILEIIIRSSEPIGLIAFLGSAAITTIGYTIGYENITETASYISLCGLTTAALASLLQIPFEDRITNSCKLSNNAYLREARKYIEQNKQ